MVTIFDTSVQNICNCKNTERYPLEMGVKSCYEYFEASSRYKYKFVIYNFIILCSISTLQIIKV